MKAVISESINEEHLYLDNDTLDERLVDVYFIEPFSDPEKIEILRSMARHLEAKLLVKP